MQVRLVSVLSSPVFTEINHAFAAASFFDEDFRSPYSGFRIYLKKGNGMFYRMCNIAAAENLLHAMKSGSGIVREFDFNVRGFRYYAEQFSKPAMFIFPPFMVLPGSRSVTTVFGA